MIPRCYSLNDKRHKSCKATEYFLHQERKEAYLAIHPCIYAVRFLFVNAICTLAGSSLIFGHPQGPTGMRLVIELIEELVLNGGGHGLFTGCAAGDTAAVVIIRVDEK